MAISEASKVLGVSITTLRRWEAVGKLIPQRTAGCQRWLDGVQQAVETSSC